MDPGFAEDLPKSAFQTPSDYTLQTTRHKMEHLLKKLKDKGQKYDFVIAADTICADSKGRIIEKPESLEHHIEMISGFSGTTFEVISSVVVLSNFNEIEEVDEFVEVTKLKFYDIPKESIVEFCNRNKDAQFAY